MTYQNQSTVQGGGGPGGRGKSWSADYNQVTKHRQVPVKVTKQRTVIKYERVSVWSFLSGNTPAPSQ
jgi:hypothetical protein